MNSLKLSTLVFALAFAAWVGCGSSTGGGTGGSIGAGGAGGGMGGAGGAGVVVDGGGGSDVPIQPDSTVQRASLSTLCRLTLGLAGVCKTTSTSLTQTQLAFRPAFCSRILAQIPRPVFRPARPYRSGSVETKDAAGIGLLAAA